MEQAVKNRMIVGLVLGAILLLATGFLMGNWLNGSHHLNWEGNFPMMHHGRTPVGGHMFGAGWLMPLFWGGLLLGSVFLVAWLLQSASSTEDRGAPATDAEAILKQRYARGELGRDEYQQMKADLSD